MAGLIIDKINDFIRNTQCLQLTLLNVTRATKYTFNLEHFYVITIKVAPSDGVFEATVKHNEYQNKYDVENEISRLNKYGSQGKNCMKDAKLLLFCLCKN